ncbi:mercury(II) reductase [Sulfodiicoccus acidiphilus]|uniref:Mercuric reductase n=1 Tax=Sulfodiicoccus acidiphilus TaxID=1670455 RepID=A0A348B1W9_9CREN|nr:mercury(II) reductase [Sulfodiicoccus acidiphilus]BBD72171.1 mercury(II) reductase [Sulfodiicoccus acidiphilus]GGT94486.1 mercury(II) reductase [Sulfodiicoccus acidiphilus]
MRELAIVGYGAAGFAALIKANELGVKPALVGTGPIGGTCVNVGCVPSKKVLRAGEVYRYAREVCDTECFPPFRKTFEEKEQLVSSLRREKYEDVLSTYDAEVFEGKAHFTSPHSLKVGPATVEAKKFVVATGSSPAVPDVPGLREVGYWTNVEALSPDKKVDSLVILGGRALALEFAQMYRRLGVEVAVLQRSQVLLPNWEPEISVEAKKILEEEGVVVATGVSVKEVRKSRGKVVVTNLGEVEADEVLLATGRKPNVDLNLEAAGVELNEAGGIRVDDELRTTNPNIFAAGDVIGGKMLEALAGRQGTVAAENALKESHRRIDLLSVPQAVFTQPNIASVGLVEREVPKAQSRKVYMRDVAKARILGESRGLVKLVTVGRRIVGVHMVGENAAEVINEAALAVKLGATVDDLVDTIHVFPTMSEALRLAALAFSSDVSKMSCCV